MSTLRRFWPVTRYLTIGFVAVLVLAVGSIRIQQYLLRRRAEQLLAEFQSLSLCRSVLPDLQKRYLRWRTAVVTQECFSLQSKSEVELTDFAYRHRDTFSISPTLTRAYGWLGGRAVQARASLWTNDGIVVNKAFAIAIQVFPREQAGRGRKAGYMLVASTRSVAGLPAKLVQGQHPAYRIAWGGGCDGCIKIQTEFLPNADSAEVRKLAEFDLSCITRWGPPCTDRADIMPAAWQERKAENPDAQ